MPEVIEVKQGDFILFSPTAGWRKGSENDLAKPLDRNVTRLGVAFEGFIYTDGESKAYHDVKHLCLKEYWQDASKSQWRNNDGESDKERIAIAVKLAKKGVEAWNEKEAKRKRQLAQLGAA
jgi:hypothetical protein